MTRNMKDLCGFSWAPLRCITDVSKHNLKLLLVMLLSQCRHQSRHCEVHILPGASIVCNPYCMGSPQFMLHHWHCRPQTMIMQQSQPVKAQVEGRTDHKALLCPGAAHNRQHHGSGQALMAASPQDRLQNPAQEDHAHVRQGWAASQL